ncbi:hypothetical protein BH11ACT6_BH11ACT6_05110 [soil metagenome]
MPETDPDDRDDAQLLEQLKAKNEAAYQELSALNEREHSDREGLEVTLKAVRSSYYWAMAQARQAESEMLAARRFGSNAEELEQLRLARDSRQWQTQVLHDEVETLRQQIADGVAREVTESNTELARETAKAARSTARATIVLAVATVALIIATLVAPMISSFS